MKIIVKFDKKRYYCNSIEELYGFFEKERDIKELDLSGNKLEEIPESICNLKNLQYLDLSGNELEKYQKV